MSTNIPVYSHFSFKIDGVPYRFGSAFKPVNRAITGDDAFVKQVSVGTSTVVRIYETDDTDGLAGVNGGLVDFDFVLIAVDFDCYVEFVTDETNAGGVESTITLPLFGSGTSGTFGIPLFLGRDDNYGSDHSQGTFGGTLDKINTVRIQNTSATQAAKVIIMAFT